MFELKQEKNRIREKYFAVRRSLKPQVKKEYDAAICHRVISLASFRYAERVLLYAPLEDEIDIYPIAQAAFEMNKKVAFPRCKTDVSEMDYYFVKDIHELSGGKYGIMEPPAENEKYDFSSNSQRDVCIVPALVYDNRGYRLGYGGGYYDRCLPSFCGTKIGLTYSRLIVQNLPRGRYDISVDVVISEKGVRTTHEA